MKPAPVPRIPPTVRIGPHTLRIEYETSLTSPDGDRLWGQYDPARQVIRLDSALRQHPTQSLETLLHEALHAIANQYHIKLNEGNTQRLATALTAFLLDNKLLRV